MTLYRILLRETGSTWHGWTTDYVTGHPDPMRVARRLLRLLNHLGNYPGGYDQVYSQAGVQPIGIWPDGDGAIRVIRAGRSPVQRRRAKEKRRRHSHDKVGI